MSTNHQAGRTPKLRTLKLTKETLQDLTEREVDEVQGGRMKYTRGTCRNNPPLEGMNTTATVPRSPHLSTTTQAVHR